jgi:hypothetical protein
MNGNGPTAALTNNREAIKAPAKLTAIWRAGDKVAIISKLPFVAPPMGRCLYQCREYANCILSLKINGHRETHPQIVGIFYQSVGKLADFSGMIPIISASHLPAAVGLPT